MKSKYGVKVIIRLQEILDEKNLTQKDFAEKMGETPQQLNKWIQGVEPCLSTLGHISLTLGVEFNDLVWFKGTNENFDENSSVCIRGDVLSIITSESQALSILRTYYRWTDEETAGVKISSYDKKRKEIVLKPKDKKTGEAFIAWAKKDHECLYRL